MQASLIILLAACNTIIASPVVANLRSTSNESSVTPWNPMAHSPADGDLVIGKRQACGVSDAETTQIWGNGNPHQQYLHIQLSQPMECGGATCSADESISKSYTIDFSLDGTIGDWISGAFDVQESWSTGNDYSCQGSPGQTVCIWQNVAHTAYTVQNGYMNECSNSFTPSGSSAIITSPNSDNHGGGYYCVVDACRGQGDTYWDSYAPAGGPPA